MANRKESTGKLRTGPLRETYLELRCRAVVRWVSVVANIEKGGKYIEMALVLDSASVHHVEVTLRVGLL